MTINYGNTPARSEVPANPAGIEARAPIYLGDFSLENKLFILRVMQAMYRQRSSKPRNTRIAQIFNILKRANEDEILLEEARAEIRRVCELPGLSCSEIMNIEKTIAISVAREAQERLAVMQS